MIFTSSLPTVKVSDTRAAVVDVVVAVKRERERQKSLDSFFLLERERNIIVSSKEIDF